jgi:hypothetical protein
LHTTGTTRYRRKKRKEEGEGGGRGRGKTDEKEKWVVDAWKETVKKVLQGSSGEVFPSTTEHAHKQKRNFDTAQGILLEILGQSNSYQFIIEGSLELTE